VFYIITYKIKKISFRASTNKRTIWLDDTTLLWMDWWSNWLTRWENRKAHPDQQFVFLVYIFYLFFNLLLSTFSLLRCNLPNGPSMFLSRNTNSTFLRMQITAVRFDSTFISRAQKYLTINSILVHWNRPLVSCPTS
jgi:hypothetical protein